MTPKSDRTDLATRALSEPGANPASAHLTRQPGQVSRQERERALGQPGLTVWFTGLSASGKSTLASALERTLVNRGRAVYYLDGDNVRLGLNRDLGFSHEARSENIRRIAEVSRLFNDAGLIVLAAFISPYRADRDRAREIVGPASFLEVYLSAPLAVCEARDPKGLYRRARRGEIPEFTGISAPYEAPLAPELILPAEMSVVQAVEALLALLLSRGVS